MRVCVCVYRKKLREYPTSLIIPSFSSISNPVPRVV